MPAFHETQFPSRISYGAKGGPERLTQIVTRQNGFEERNQIWAHSRRMYDASMGLRNIGDLQDVMQFWEARRGQLYGFRWKDWADYKTSRGRLVPSDTDVILSVGDDVATDFQLVKRYSDAGEEYVRPVKKPIAGTVLVSLDDVSLTSGWTVDTVTGIITFDTAPGAGVVVKSGFEFDVPVRFDAADIAVNVDAFEAGSIQSINVKEIRV